MHYPVSPFRADEYKIGRIRFGASFGATGNMRRAGEMRAGQDICETMAVAAGVKGS